MAEDYFLEIEAHFVKRRGTPFILNAKDWALIKKWHEEGIPLALVIEAIDAVFDRNEAAGSRKVISSLSYCRHAVKEIWSDRRELQVGAESATPEESAEPTLEALAARLEGSSLPAAAAFAARVRGLAAEKSVPRIEERLIDIEEELIAAALESAADASALRAAAAEIGSAPLDEKTRTRTVAANLRRMVRERYGLPRLTLF